MAEVLRSLKALDIKSNGVVQATHVDLSATTTSINPQTHGSRLLVVTNPTGSAVTLTMDTAKAPGINYHFVYGGDAVAANNIIIACESTSDKMSGSLSFIDTNYPDGSGADRADAVADDKLTLASAAAFDITLTSNTAVGDANASWIINGYTVGATAPAFSST